MLTDQEIEALFGFHPAPGSTAVMWDLQHRVAARASTLTEAADGLDRVSADDWRGHGADAFHGTLGNLRRDVRTAAGAHGDCATALYAYIGEQESARTQAQALAQEALQAHASHQSLVNQVTQHSQAPDGETDAAKADREQQLEDARRRAGQAQSDFDDVVRRARALQTHMDGVAGDAKARIDAAAHRAPYREPGLLERAWDGLKHAGSAVWHVVSSPEFLHGLSTALNIVSAVCAFIPGLQGVAIVAAVLAIGVDILAKVAAGEPISWMDVGLDAALCFIPGGRVARVFRAVPPRFRGAVVGAVLGGTVAGVRDAIDGRGFSATDIAEGAAFGALTAAVGERLSSRIQTAASASRAEANAAQSVRPRPTMASGLVTSDGQVFSAASIKGQPTAALHPDVQAVMDAIPANQRSNFHSFCSEPQAISQALNAGLTKADLQGAVISTQQVRGAGNAAHGQPRDPCESCQQLLDAFGIRSWP
jgi:hypothetical protein